MTHTNTDQEKTANRLRKDRNKLIAVTVGAAAIIGASFAVPAVADSRMFQHAKLYVTEANTNEAFIQKAGWGERRGWFGHHRHGGWANLSDEEIESRINRVVKHVAIEIDATPEQTVKITQLLSAVAKDMKPLRGEFREAGKKMHDLLISDTIDREALEKLRSERMAEIDRRSRQVVNAVADVAEVLTAEQRATLDKRIKEFRSMRHGWRRG